MARKFYEFDGMRFGPDELKDNRQLLIELRDAALKATNFEYAVALSHTIAVMAQVIRDVEQAQ